MIQTNHSMVVFRLLQLRKKLKYCPGLVDHYNALKNSILEKSGLSLLRLRTIESGIEDKIAKFLMASIGANANKDPPISAGY